LIMPRQSRGRSAAPRSAPAQSPQSRAAHTAAFPPGASSRTSAAPPAASSAAPAAASSAAQPGMIAQMAATAGSVAIGSTIGHGLSSMLFGGGGNAAEAQAPPVQQQSYQQSGAMDCAVQAKDFTKCLDSADIDSCRWYLDQLKQCQAAAAEFMPRT